MIRVTGCGHLEKGGSGWNSERKGVFLWKGACVLVKVLLRVEKKIYNASTGNGREWTVQMAILVSCYRIVVLITADSYSVVYVHYVTKILLNNVKNYDSQHG